MKLRLSILILILLISSAVHAKDMRKAYIKALDENRKANDSLTSRSDFINRSRNDLLKQINIEKSKIGRLNRSIKSLNSGISGVEKKLNSLLKKNSANSKERHELSLNVRSAATDLNEILDSSILSSTDKDRGAFLNIILNKKRFPGMEDIVKLSDLYFEEMVLSGEVEFTKNNFINKEGVQERGKILRIGKFCAILMKKNGETGFLKYSPNTKDFCELANSAEWKHRSNFEEYMDGKVRDVYLDITHGAALRQISHKKSLLDQISSGGILVYPILILGFIALCFGIERIFALKKLRTDSDQLMLKISENAIDGNIKESASLIPENSKIPVHNVIKAGLTSNTEDRETLETILQEAMLKEIPRVEKKLSLLAVTGSVTPLLGLLGTVTGMIKTFHSITLYGSGDPRLMSGGISEALVTTMLGLAVAIPVMLIHTYLNQKVDSIANDMEEKAVGICNIILLKKEKETKRDRKDAA
ncbi:MAG: MotA/TolQ/ExbB proton channel family protein [Deltaproteobacteria bacterium]|nr:MotA/TolQ/ExbB proton channel family protein [Deltaproteobacteria bacterium]